VSVFHVSVPRARFPSQNGSKTCGKPLQKVPTRVVSVGSGQRHGGAHLQAKQELRREDTAINPLLRPALSRAPACTRVASRGQGAPYPWPPSPQRSPGIPAPLALIAERRSRLAWVGPLCACCAFFLPSWAGARRSRSSGTGCGGRLFSPLTGALSRWAVRSGLSRWGCEGGSLSCSWLPHARNRSDR
jgi:hypothetical protein